MNVGRYLRGEDRHVGTARTNKGHPMTPNQAPDSTKPETAEREELIAQLESLIKKFNAGWHEGIQIDATDIATLCEATALLEADGRAGGEVVAPYTQAGKAWAIDHSAGRPILVLNGCSVIEAEDAEYVLSLVRNADATPPQQEQAAPHPDEFTCPLCFDDPANIKAAPGAVQDGWMPIETAPKTTKSILVHCSEMRNTYVVAWSHTRDGGEGWVYFCPGNYMLIEEPTHWMPLPAAPKAQEPGA